MLNQKHKHKLFFVLSLCLFLTACGFHLRGNESLPAQLKVIYIKAAPYDPLTLALKQALRSDGIKVVKHEHDAPLTLQILNVQFNQHLVNISANALVRSYRLQYIVTIRLFTQHGKVIVGPLNVETSSSYAENDNQVLGDNSQLTQIQNNMRRDVVGLIFNRLNAKNVRVALK